MDNVKHGHPNVGDWMRALDIVLYMALLDFFSTRILFIYVPWEW